MLKEQQQKASVSVPFSSVNLAPDKVHTFSACEPQSRKSIKIKKIKRCSCSQKNVLNDYIFPTFKNYE
jgi:hypothetical protein